MASIRACARLRQFSMQLKPYFNVHALIFFQSSTCEESSSPMKQAKKFVSTFLTMKAMIKLNTHGKKHYQERQKLKKYE